MLVKLSGDPCGHLLFSDSRITPLSTEKVYSRHQDVTIGVQVCIYTLWSNNCLRFTSSATGVIYKTIPKGENFVKNTRDIATFVAVSVF